MLIPIASYYSIKRLPLNYFSYPQQDHQLNGIGISLLFPHLYCKNAKRVAPMFIVTTLRKAYLDYRDLYFQFINRGCYEYY